jgi:SAM-dependent methyltransferase
MTEPWSNFFAEAWPRIQADGYPAEQTAAQCDLIQRTLALREGAQVLDIPCGIGRHSVELARRGFRTTGIDFNPEFVEVARANAAAAGVEATFVVGDMREFTSPSTFDAAFCYFGSFGYFTEHDDSRFAGAVLGALRPGGRFLVEGHIMETWLPIFRERDWFWVGTEDARIRVTEERSWQVATGRVEVTWTLIDESGPKSYATSIRIYSFLELQALLISAGFASVQLLDGKSGQAFRIGSPRAIVVAEKSTE